MKKKIVGILVMMLLIATALPAIGVTIKKIGNENPPPLQNGEVDQEQTTHSGYGMLLSPPYRHAQSFKPTKEILTDVQLRFFKHTNPPAGVEITVSIRDALNGADLTAKTINADDEGIPGSGKWVSFNFEDITVIPEETYYIVCYASGGGTSGNCYCWYFGLNDLYTRGEAWSSDTNGATWVTLEEMHPQFPEPDFCFKTYGIANNAPNKPVITGETNGKVGEEYCCNISSVDPDDDDIMYLVEWDDGETTETEYFPSGMEVEVCHTYAEPGTYVIKAKAKDVHNFESDWSDSLFVNIGNPPSAPDINGPSSGKAGTPIAYEFTSTDPDGDDISYYIKWGDGDVTDWTAFQASGPPGYSESHTWDEQDEYTIEAKAKDTFGAESDWGELTVTMPRNRATYNSLFLRFLEQFPILRLLFQRLELQ